MYVCNLCGFVHNFAATNFCRCTARHEVTYWFVTNRLTLYTGAALTLSLHTYVHVTVSNTASAVQNFATCICDINERMRASRLRLNPAKAQAMWLGLLQQLRQVDVHDILILSTKVKVVESARNLGVIFDSQKLQSVPKAAARFITGAIRCDHISHVVALATSGVQSCMSGTLVVVRSSAGILNWRYLPCRWQWPCPSQISSRQDLRRLVPPTYNTSGDKSFTAAGTLWQTLPSYLRRDIRLFKRKWKHFCSGVKWPRPFVFVRFRNILIYLLTDFLTYLFAYLYRHKRHGYF